MMSHGDVFFSDVDVPKVGVCLQRVGPPERLRRPPLDSIVGFLRRGGHFGPRHLLESKKM